MIAVLLRTSLRVSELLALDIDRYDGRGFVNVLRKGGSVQKYIPVQRQQREVLEEWLAERGNAPGPVFLTRSGARLDRRQAFLILQRIARQANTRLPEAEKIKVSPHLLTTHQEGEHEHPRRSPTQRRRARYPAR